MGCRGLYVDFTAAALAQSLEREVVASRRGRGGGRGLKITEK